MVNINYVGCARPKFLASKLLSELCTPLSLDKLNCLLDDDWVGYFEAELEREGSPRDVAIDSLVDSLLKKSPNILSSDIDEKTVALFEKNEQTCYETNRRLAKLSDLSPFESHFWVMKSKIASILGKFPTSMPFNFGPGVNVGRKGVDTGAYAKLSVLRPSVTPKAAPFAALYLKDTLWGQYLSRGSDNKMSFEKVVAAEIAFVPKNFKIKRVIAIEPLLNTYFQKGIGSHIRDRLKYVGVDLRQQTLNQEAASYAQERGLATVDFTSASDTISISIVNELLPIDWVHVLDTFRTPCAHLQNENTDEFYFLQKFSSMGNGFTFELESLLFYAAAFAVVKLGSGRTDEIRVYGDDVILPKEDYSDFKALTAMMGFQVSDEKSFVTGRFFESCGVDYYDGVNVRPFYLKNDLSSDYDVFECHNALLQFSLRWKCAIPETLAFLEKLVPRERHLCVPFPYSGGFWADCDRDRNITPEGWEGSVRKALVFKPSKKENEHFEPAILHSLNGPSEGSRALRGVGRWVVRKQFFPAI